MAQFNEYMNSLTQYNAKRKAQGLPPVAFPEMMADLGLPPVDADADMKKTQADESKTLWQTIGDITKPQTSTQIYAVPKEDWEPNAGVSPLSKDLPVSAQKVQDIEGGLKDMDLDNVVFTNRNIETKPGADFGKPETYDRMAQATMEAGQEPTKLFEQADKMRERAAKTADDPDYIKATNAVALAITKHGGQYDPQKSLQQNYADFAGNMDMMRRANFLQDVQTNMSTKDEKGGVGPKDFLTQMRHVDSLYQARASIEKGVDPITGQLIPQTNIDEAKATINGQIAQAEELVRRMWPEEYTNYVQGGEQEAPQPEPTGNKQIVRRGKEKGTGRPVVMYSDGSISYAQ